MKIKIEKEIAENITKVAKLDFRLEGKGIKDVSNFQESRNYSLK